MRAYAVLQWAERASFFALQVIQRNPHGAHLALGQEVKVGRVAVECEGPRAGRLYPNLIFRHVRENKRSREFATRGLSSRAANLVLTESHSIPAH
jgi:hypothetical protein